MASTGITTPLIHGPRSTNEGYKYRSGLGIVESAEYCVFHDDFNTLVTTNVPLGWAAAVIDIGSTVLTDTTAATSATGVIALFDATVSEGPAIYTPKGFQLTAGKKAFVECRVYLNDVTDADFQFGLSAVTASTNPEDLWTTTSADLAAFGILDGGSGVVTMLADKSNSGTTAETGTITLTASQWNTLAIGYDGTNLTGWVNGQLAITYSQTAGIPTGVALAAFIGARNGNGAGSNVNLVDYIRVAVQR